MGKPVGPRFRQMVRKIHLIYDLQPHCKVVVLSSPVPRDDAGVWGWSDFPRILPQGVSTSWDGRWDLRFQKLGMP